MATRLLWITNLAAPYRIPVWESLGRSLELRVGLLENNRRLARDAALNRGRDWLGAPGQSFALREYRTVRARRGDERHYGLVVPDAALDLARSDAVLLGGWDSPAYFQLLAQAKLMRKPAIGFYESTLSSHSRTGGPISATRARYFRSLDAVVVPGEAAAEAVLAMGVAREKVFVGFNAVDTEAFSRGVEVPPHAGHAFGFVGRLIPLKRVDEALRAFAQVANEEDTFRVVGTGELRQELEQLCHELGITHQVEFVGAVANKELVREMHQIDTLLLVSDREVWGLVVNEALAAGCQAIISEVCGVAQSVRTMTGVQVVRKDLVDLPQTMVASREQWRGRIAEPEIRRYTAAAFAEVFAAATDYALSRSGEDR